MCEHPIYIRNTSKRYAEGLTKLGFWVPCGKCESCRQEMRDNWFLRAYAEYLDCIEKGGKVYFVTLTYNPKSRPMFNPKTRRLCHGLDRKKDGCIPCFCKADIDRYRNSLNKWFERKGFTGIRYLICSEYGTDENAQHLPHYHGLIYVPSNDISDKEVENVILDSWKFGYSFYSNKGAAVESLKGIKYVTKYCCKQVEYYEQPIGIESEERPERFEEVVTDERLFMLWDNDREAYEAMKPYFPQHWQSKGFGIYIAKWLKNKDIDSLIEYFSRGLGQDFLGLEGDEDRFYNLPRYIVDKLLYKVNDKGVRVHSELGAEIAPKLFSIRLDKCEKNLKRYFTANGLRGLIDPTDCHDVITLSDYYKEDVPNNYAGLSGFLCETLNGRPLRELALYMKVFRGLTLPERDMWLYNEIESLDTEGLECAAYSILKDAENDDNYIYSDVQFKFTKGYDKCFTWSASPRFDGFETILTTIQNIQSLSSKRKSAKKKDDDEVITKLKNVLNG